jgi:hypothetical protein
MPFEKNSGLNVNNFYGPRDTGGSLGTEDRDGTLVTLSVNLTGASLNNLSFLPPVQVPKGALFRRAQIRVDEAFVVTGTSPTVRVGSLGSISTNGVVITEAELENVGTKSLASTGAGTWAFNSSTGVTAAALVGIDLGGTSPVVSPTVGKATLVLEYLHKAKS